MAASNSKNQSNLGFLTIVSDPTEARIGGLLLVNASGRPLEFHCTAPVKPNRAQEILYGPTLGEYLCGEQIGMALSEALKHQPSLLLTDIPETLSLRPLIDFPLLLLATEENLAGSLGQNLVQTATQRSDPHHARRIRCGSSRCRERTANAGTRARPSRTLRSYSRSNRRGSRGNEKIHCRMSCERPR